MTADLRLAIPAAVSWAAAGLLTGAPEAAFPVAVVLGAAAVSVVAIGLAIRVERGRQKSRPGELRRGRSCSLARGRFGVIGVVLACLAATVLAASSVMANAPQRQPAALVAASAEKTRVVVTLQLQSVPVIASSGTPKADRVRFRGSAHDVRTGTIAFAGSVPVVVFSALPITPLHIGDDVTVEGTIRSLDAADSAAFLLFSTGAPRRVAPAPAWLAWANDLREQFSLAAQALPGDGGDLVPGLSIGDTRAVSAELDASMKTSSLSHLTAVSGANCAVITGLAILLTGFLGFRRRTRIAASLALLTGFVVLVTPDASVLRAALMSVIVIFSQAAGRPARGIPALAAVVIGLVVFDPWLSRNYGFALSVLATFGLLALAKPLTDRLTRVMPAALASMIAIPLAAQLACQPVLILLNPTIPLYGVAANLLAGPAAPAGTVIGLLACLLVPWIPGLGFACAQLAWVPASWIASVAHAIAALPGSQLPWLGGFPGIATLSFMTILILVVVLWRGRRDSTVRVISVIALIATGGAYTGILLGAGTGERLSVPGDWQIAACDVGQGDAVVVRSGLSYALIDVGPDPASLHACLDRLGVERLDLLVLSHFDLDHVGGLGAVIGRVSHALVGEAEDPRDESDLAALRSGGASVTQVVAGDTGNLGDAAWSVVWPRADTESMSRGNDGSVVITFTSPEMTSIFLGDLGEVPQQALLSSQAIGSVDLVKVAHHGSADQSAQLYRVLDAQLGLISSGADNTYGHPTASLLTVLEETSTLPLRTDERALIVISPTGEADRGFSVWSSVAEQKATVRSAPIRLSLLHHRLVSERRGEQWQYAKRVLRERV